MKKIFLIINLLFPLVGFCQPQLLEIEKKIEMEVEQIRVSGRYQMAPYRFDSTNEKYFFNHIDKYLNDTSSNVRRFATEIKFIIAFNSYDSSIRKIGVEQLLNRCFNRNIPCSEIFEDLTYFRQNDFNLSSKTMLSSMAKEYYRNSNFIMVCGTAQINDIVPFLKQLPLTIDRSNTAWFNTRSWFANLALLRLGERGGVDHVIASVELELSPTFRANKLFKDLAYTKDPDCLRILQKYLESSDRLPSSHGRVGAEFNQYALQYLATYLDDFPIKSTEGGYTAAELNVAREFMRNRQNNTRSH